jgi:alkylated DNA repair dioxygenase AlkB
MDSRQLSLWDRSPLPDGNSAIKLDLPDAEIYLYPALLSQTDGDQWFATLKSSIQWQQDWIKIAGKTIPIPRLTAWYGDRNTTYTYSGITMVPHPWIDPLLHIKSTIETLAHTCFNSVLLNLYRDGNDSVAWHSDDEPELGRNPVIASLSLGGSRRFMLRHKHDKALTHTLELTHGSGLLMQGSTQHYWLHQVPKTAKPVDPRINLTFRTILRSDRPS